LPPLWGFAGSPSGFGTPTHSLTYKSIPTTYKYFPTDKYP